MILRRAVAALLFLAAPAVAQVQTPADALAQDAATYARTAGLSADEAAAQLRAQGETVPVTTALAVEFRARLAGVAVEHHPYRIVVRLTGDAPEPDRHVAAGGLDVSIVFRPGATATHTRLAQALLSHQAAIRALLPHPPGLGVDPRAGVLIVMLPGVDADRYPPGELEAKLAALTGVPVRLRVTDRIDANTAVDGGARIEGVADGHRYACTTGFVVTDGARDGVVTAAHCPDDAEYVGPAERVPLPFLGQWGWSYQDVQLHRADQPLEPFFYADTAKTVLRPVTATRGRAATRAGDVVCHRGERTGYSCAEVELTDFAPSGDLCGGPCAPSWVTVAGPSCRAGDSGGPVFDGTTALGIVKGASYRPDGSCGFYYYMSIDYLPTGWRVLTQSPSGDTPAGSVPATDR